MKRIIAFFLVIMLLALSMMVSIAETTSPNDGIAAAVEAFLTTEMKRQSTLATNEWQCFIYSQGVTAVTMNLDKFDIAKGGPLVVEFLVASAQPDVKNQLPYQGDPTPWLKSVVNAMEEPDTRVKLSLIVTPSNDEYVVSYAKGAEASLQKKVKALGSKVPNAMSDQKILAAVVDYLMPSPIIMPKKVPKDLSLEVRNLAYAPYLERNGINPSDSPYTAALLYAIKGQKLDATHGPEKLVLMYTVPYLSTKMKASSDNLYSELVYDSRAKQYTVAELISKFANHLEKDLVAYRYGKKADLEETYVFSLLDLPIKLRPEDFYHHESETPAATSASYLAEVKSKVTSLPNYPAIPNPKNGIVMGENRGTKFTFKFKNGGGKHNCVSAYDQWTQELVSIAFASNGKSVSMRLPKGDYSFEFGEGDVWYGPDHLFGPSGNYYSSKYYYESGYGGWTITVSFR